MSDNNKIGKFISKLRKEKGMTQQELGDLLYVTDKAVSKWERGLSLPDVTILNKLADILSVSVSEILDGKRNEKEYIDIDKKIEEVTIQMEVNQKNKIKKIFSVFLVIGIILVYLVFKNIYLGYDIKKIDYSKLSGGNREIELGVPKLSFMVKNYDRSFSFKNLRNDKVVENEIKNYLKTLDYLTCNDTIYYYNGKDNFSLIEYSVNNNILFSTVSYQIIDGDYCYKEKMNEYSKYIILRKIYGINNYVSQEYLKDKLVVMFINGGNDPNNYQFKAEMIIKYYDKWGKVTVLEESSGDYEIKNGKLIYYRNEILKEKINIPQVSTFMIDNQKLILEDNYLEEYLNEIILR